MFARSLLFGRYVQTRNPAAEAPSLLAFDTLFYEGRAVLDRWDATWAAAGRGLRPTAAELAAYLRAVETPLLHAAADLARFCTCIAINITPATAHRALHVSVALGPDAPLGPLPPPSAVAAPGVPANDDGDALVVPSRSVQQLRCVCLWAARFFGSGC
jgi:hypothetical protein